MVGMFLIGGTFAAGIAVGYSLAAPPGAVSVNVSTIKLWLAQLALKMIEAENAKRVALPKATK